MADIRRPRRFYLHKRAEALADGDAVRAGIWRAKQEAEAGSPLASDFPARAALAAAGYETAEDLDGADVDELLAAGLTQGESTIVLAALASL